ncbi:MAG: sialate O-acetylesterase [Planctomycetota bacterium]|nr:sialate O-acetylesterase [Planctomycetota bacterium]
MKVLTQILMLPGFILPLSHADVSLPVVIDSNMVLQRGIEAPIWGWADAGEEITVSFAGQEKTAATDNTGSWKIKLDPLEASSEGRALTVKGKNEIKLENVLVGEVWICSGQSNMEWSVSRSLPKSRTLAAKENKNPNLRLFRVPAHIRAGSPLSDTVGTWTNCTNHNDINNFSGVGFYFGRKLQHDLKVPIGLLDTSWGGTPIEAWISAEGYEMIKQPLPKPNEAQQKALVESFKKLVDSVEQWQVKARVAAAQGRVIPLPSHGNVNFGNSANGIYNAMVAPLAPYGVRGAIWYQGEANRGRPFPDYFNKLKALIGGWRKVFEAGDFPFYIVQIAPFDYNRGNRKRDDTPLCKNVWAAEFKAAEEIPNCGVVPIHDTIQGNLRNIHPADKQTVGERLASLALKDAYEKDVPWTGPLFKSATQDGKQIVITFEHIDKGLGTSDGKAPSWFEIAGANKEFVAADAAIEGATVVIKAEAVLNPKLVRMGWSEVAIPNLRDKNGWPVRQFTAGIK